jgi:hypothetical protein
MNTLEEAWQWYETTCRHLKLLRRLGEHYWDLLPWDRGLEREERFHTLEGDQVQTEAAFSLTHLDDLAVVVLFSVFEAQVRQHILDEMLPEIRNLRHRALRLAAEETQRQVSEGSFFRVLQPFKDAHADLVEEVNQVRRYRNWVAHGKGGSEPDRVTPQLAYTRLQRFLAAMGSIPAST